MRIQYLSDLHLEFRDNADYLRHHLPPVTGDILVVAGDCCYLNEKMAERHGFFRWASDHYEQVLLVSGNHEYYGYGDPTERGFSWEYRLLPNVSYYQNRVVRLHDTDIILSTLWSHISEYRLTDVWMGLNDFRKILYGHKRFTPYDFNREHARCLAFIMDAVEKSDAMHRVVVTHHVPTLQCVDPAFRNSPINSAFAADLTNYIEKADIDAWIYGHSHYAIDAEIGGTKVVSNQLGYVFRGENEYNGFSSGRFMEV